MAKTNFKVTFGKSNVKQSIKYKLKMSYLYSVEKVNAYITQNYNIGLYCVIASIIQTTVFLIYITDWNSYYNQDNMQISSNNTLPTWYTLTKFIFTLYNEWISYYIAFGIAFGYIIALSINCILTIILNNRTIYMLFATFGYLHRHFAYFIVHYTLMKGIFANVNNEIYYEMYSNTHISLTAIGLFGAFLNFSLAMMTNNWYFTTQRTDRLARFHRMESIWIIRNQALIGMLIHIPYNLTYIKIVISSITILCGTMRLYWLIRYSLYSDYTIVRLKSCGCILEIISSILINLSLLFDNYDQAFLIICIAIISGILCIIFILGIIEESWNSILYKNFHELSNEEEALKHFYAFQSLTINGIGKSVKASPKRTRKLLMNGLMFNHYANCGKDDCSCKYNEYMINKNKPEDDQFEKTVLHFTKDPNAITHFSRYLLEEYLKKFPNSLSIKLHCIQYFLESLKLYHKGYMMIQHLNGIEPLLPFYLIIRLHELKSKFHEKVHGETSVVLKKGLDIMNMIIFSELENEFIEMLETQVSNMQNFWGEYLKNDIMMKSLFEVGLAIFSTNVKIEKHWETIAGIVKKRVKFPYLLYGIYMAICNNATIMAEDLVETYKRVADAYVILEKDPQLTQYTLFADDNMYFVCSAEIEKPGIIYLCSENVNEETGFSKEDLMGKTINNVIPPIYARDHDRYMLEYIETGKQSVFHATRKIFYLHRDGTITPCYLHMKPGHHDFHGMVFLGVIKPYRTCSEFILTDENGQIDSSTPEIRKDLMLNRQSIYNTKKFNNISVFNQKFQLINEAFTYFTKNQHEYNKIISGDGVKALNKSTIDEAGRLIFNDYDSKFAIYEAFKTGVDLVITVPKNLTRATGASEKLRRMFSLTPQIKYVYTIKISDHFFRGTELVRVYELIKVEHNNVAAHLMQNNIGLLGHLYEKTNHNHGHNHNHNHNNNNNNTTPTSTNNNNNNNNNPKNEECDTIPLGLQYASGNTSLKEIAEDENEDLITQIRKIDPFGKNGMGSPIKKGIKQSKMQNVEGNKDNERHFNFKNAIFKKDIIKPKSIDDSYLDENFSDKDNKHENPYSFYSQSKIHSLGKIEDNSSFNKNSNINSEGIFQSDNIYGHESDELILDEINEACKVNIPDLLLHNENESTPQTFPQESSILIKDYEMNKQQNNNKGINSMNGVATLNSHRDQTTIENILLTTKGQPHDTSYQNIGNNTVAEHHRLNVITLNDGSDGQNPSLENNDDEGDTERKKIKHFSFTQLVGKALAHGFNHRAKKPRKLYRKKTMKFQMNKKLADENLEIGDTEWKINRILSQGHDNNKEKVKLFDEENENRMIQSVGGSSFFGMRQVEQAIEKAVNSPYVSNSAKSMLWFFCFFIVLNIILGLVNYLVEDKQINEIYAEMQSIYYSHQQLDDIIEMNRRARSILLVETDFLSETRHLDMNVTSYSNFSREKLFDAAVNLKSVAAAMRLFLYTYIGKSYRDQITNGKITLYWNESNSFITTSNFEVFDAVQTLVVEGISAVGDGINGYTLDLNNPHISFILNNTHNGYLVGLSKGSEIFKNAILDSLYSIAMIEYIISIIGAMFLIIYYASYYIQHYRIDKEKTYTLKLLTTINPINIRTIISRLNIMKEFLAKKKDDSVNLIDVFISKKNRFEKELNNNKVNIKKFKFGKLNPKGLNHNLCISIIKMIIAIIFVLWYYILKSILFTIFQNNCHIVTSQITNTYFNLYAQGLSMSLIYELISTIDDNNSVNANNNIKSYNDTLLLLNYVLSMNSDLQNFIINFKDGNNVRDDVLLLLNGDICYLVDNNMQNLCKTYCDGAATRGILAMSAYMQRILTNLRDKYVSNTNHDKQTSIKLLDDNNLMQLETMYYLFMRPTYDILLGKLNMVFDSETNAMKFKAILLFIIFTIIVISIWFIILMPLHRNIILENRSLKKFLKLIPTNVLMMNKLLMRYLVHTSPEFFNLANLI